MRAVFALAVFALPALAAPVPKELKKKESSPDGVWVLAGFSSDGEALHMPQSMTRDWVVSGEHLFVGTKVEPAYGARGQANFTTPDPAKPNLRVWGTMMASLEVDGDTLRACYAHDGRKEHPECKPAKGIHYYEFKRVK